MITTLFNELKKCSKNKVTLVVSVVIPLLVCLVLGWEFSEGVVLGIPMGVVDLDKSNLSQTVVQYFEGNDTFDVRYFEESAGRLEELLKDGSIKTAMIIPPNFQADVGSAKSPTVVMLYDGSSMSIASAAKMKATEILTSVRVYATIKQLQGKLGLSYDQALVTAMPISVVNKNLFNPTKNFLYFLLPGISIAMVQIGLSMAAVVCINSEEKKSRKNVLGFALGKILFYSVLGSVVFVVALFLLDMVFKVPLRGSLINAIYLCSALSFCVTSICCAVSSWVSDTYTSIIIAGVLFIPNTILSGYTWPTLGMPNIYVSVAKIIPYYHVADNVRSIFLSEAPVSIVNNIVYLLYVGIGACVICYLGVLFKNKEKQVGVTY